ncbi:BRISC and BRCA1-A complex member 1 [Geodia barretti]|uniref:BRISC and BRCA1-A complex member 1 n=1 Tax=Geodia barretti TaxID=519541 RepID=A0AA35SW83_GEOBA|nr:BRISC and BRCA1-A complex member 1 [Geodia barretti]
MMEGDSQSLSSVGSDLNLLGSATYEFQHQDIHSSCPEKIIICVDLAQEVETIPVKSQSKGTSVSLLTCLKNALRLFVYNKTLMNSEHEFALVVLTSEANWFCNFNSDPALVCQAINDLEAVQENFESFDTASLYSIIYENCPPPPVPESPLLSPPYVVRTILIYTRSHSMPVYRGDPAAHDALTMSPYFFLDVLYAHEPPGISNMCEGIFDILAEMYPLPKALVLDWSHNITLLFNCFAKLLAHPLQRPVQIKMDHKLDS